MSEQGSTPVGEVSAPVESAPVEGIQQESQSGQKAPQTKAQVSTPQKPSAPELFEVKVNGKVEKWTREEVLAKASMSHAAQKNFEEAAKIKKQYGGMKDTAQKDFMKILQDPELGLSKDQIRERFEKWYMEEYVEPETLTPEERKYKEMEAKVKKYEQDAEEKHQREVLDHEEKLTQKHLQTMNQKIIDTLEKSGLKKSKYNAARIASYMLQNAHNGWDAPEEFIIQQLKKERKETLYDDLGHLDGDALIQEVGEETAKKINRYYLEQMRTKRRGGMAESAPPMPQATPEDNRPLTSREVDERLRKMRMGLL